MQTQDLEFLISQHLDGALSAEEEAALQTRLSTDSAARALLAEYRKLHAAFGALPPVPEVAWDRLAETISSAVAEADEEAARERHSLRWLRLGSRLAAAAAVIFGIGVIARVATDTGGPVGPGKPPAVAQVEVLIPDAPAAPQQAVVAQVEFGPSPSIPAGANWYATETLVQRPSTVRIATVELPPVDPATPFAPH